MCPGVWPFLLLTGSWDREKKETQLQSSHLSSLPRKVTEKLSLELEPRTGNQNLLSMAEDPLARVATERLAGGQRKP